MKRHELLIYFDGELLDKLFGFCYARTSDSYEAQELCSDIIFALVKAAHSEGEISSLYSFIWRVARNVYADFSANRRKRADAFYEGDADEIFAVIADEAPDADSAERIGAIYRRIAFLTKAYREVMILYYIDGLSTAEIAERLNTSEVAVRQRLFSARQKVKSEVETMTEMNERPLALDEKEYVIWGTGDPTWGDPREVCTRMFSRHIVWLCHKKSRTAAEIAAELNVPTVYVEEELEILRRGKNGEYGLLRRLDNGRYAMNFILLDRDVIEKAQALYAEHLPKICDIIADYIEENKEKYLSFPYLNRKVELNLILWQQVTYMSRAFSYNVESVLKERYFKQVKEVERPFSVYGYVDNGRSYGGGWDGVDARNICGYAGVQLENIYLTRIRKHFHCGWNVSNDPQLQLAIRAIDGVQVSSLSGTEKEQAAKAIECGYLYREDDMLYTKILVNSVKDKGRLFDISRGLRNGYFEEEAALVAEKLAALIRKSVPDYLLGEWRHANTLANLPVIDSLVAALIEKGILIPPEDGIGAEGCWMAVER